MTDLPRVTHVLSALGLRSSFAGVDPSVLDYAAARGTVVHLACHLDDAGKLDEASLDPVIAPYLEAWRSFRHDTGFEVLLSEHKVSSRVWRYRGTLDCEGWFGARRAVVDIKSGAWDPSTPIQVAAYRLALAEMAPSPSPRESWTVELRDDGTYRPIDNDHEEPRAEQLWQAAITLYHWRREHGR